MTGKMTKKDYAAASIALLDWLESQEIGPEDAPRVLTTTLVGIIRELAEKRTAATPKQAAKSLPISS